LVNNLNVGRRSYVLKEVNAIKGDDVALKLILYLKEQKPSSIIYGQLKD